MGEEVGGGGSYDFYLVGGGGGYEGMTEWENGLPGADDLTPLSQPLVPPGLAAAFRIPPEPGRTLLDVHRASAATVSRLRRAPSSSSSGGGGGSGGAGAGGSFPAFPAGASSKAAGEDSAADAAAESEKTKRPRLVWTPQLHKRFVDVVAHLGIKSAVPKTIMQLMNVEGLTRENVASHLQKYRLYVKRMQGLSDEGPSPSDHIFASTPVPPSLREPQVPAAPPPPPPPAAVYPHHHHHHHYPAAGMTGGHYQHGNGHAVYNGYGGGGHRGHHGHGVSSYPHYYHGDQ